MALFPYGLFKMALSKANAEESLNNGTAFNFCLYYTPEPGIMSIFFSCCGITFLAVVFSLFILPIYTFLSTLLADKGGVCITFLFTGFVVGAPPRISARVRAEFFFLLVWCIGDYFIAVFANPPSLTKATAWAHHVPAGAAGNAI